jgi:uncharacterized membrane protein
MPRYFSVRPSLTFKGRKFKGIRGFAGKPFHPPLTDIPVAAYFLAAVFDVISYVAEQRAEASIAADFYEAATYTMVAGAIVSVPTILTGFWDWLKSAPSRTQAWRTANTHMALMLAASAVVVVDILLRLAYYGADARFADLQIMILSVLAGALVSIGSYFGGSLVYEYAFNVEQNFDHAYVESERDVLPFEKEGGN